MDDDDLRWLIISSGFLLAVVYLMGGLLTRVSGIWQDGERRIKLTQIGPLVRGEAVWPEGRQVFRGRAFWGRVRLTRSDTGERHLLDLGFTAQQLPALQEQDTGHFILRCQGETLHGEFIGRKFSFDDDAIRSVSHVEPVPRVWTRIG